MFDRDLIAAKLRRWESYLRDFSLPTWDELPNFDLYMDQVVSLLTQYLAFLPPEELNGKLVSASAINNYVRMRIMPAPVKKKYSRIHMAYLVMICTLKQSLNIAQIEQQIPVDLPEDAVQRLYDNYVSCYRHATLYFIDEVHKASNAILHADAVPAEQLENAVENLVTASTVISGFARLMAAKILQLQDTALSEVEPDALALQAKP